MKNKIFLIFLVCFLSFSLISSAHYIVGYVNDALDGTLADTHEVVLYNPSVGESDNLTDVIGVTGNSFASQMYLIDCELLNIPCEVGDNLTVRVYDNGDNYVSTHDVFVNVTGAGFDFMDNLTLNSPIIFNSIVVDDELTFTPNEIDLLAASSRTVTCSAVVEDLDGGGFSNFYSEFFGQVSSSYGDTDDNNYHYTNSSCFEDSSYGTLNQSQINCTYELLYYSNTETWRCRIVGGDFFTNTTGEDTTFVNPLISIEMQDNITFGIVDSEAVSPEEEVVIYNRGNVLIDLALSGYGTVEGDFNSMTCTKGENISIDYKKYNLTSSNFGNLTLSQFEFNYTNLTTYPVTNDFNLNYRRNDTFDDAFNSTFWRVYVPYGSGGDCSGNIIFGAVLST
jgi:hypothetical protein